VTQPSLELTDPGSAFLASGNPERFLADNLPGINPTPADPVEDHHQRNAAIAIAGLFLAWRYYVSHQLKGEVPPSDPEAVTLKLWMRLRPRWMKIATPVAKSIYREFGTLAPEDLEAVAADYAAELGNYVHETSSEALVYGYAEQLSKGTSPSLAWMRTIEGYGLDKRRLKGWLKGVANDKTVPEDLISPGGRRALERALLLRAELLGENEAWHARHIAKSVVWLHQVAAGCWRPAPSSAGTPRKTRRSVPSAGHCTR
jgi:hypothetical protein